MNDLQPLLDLVETNPALFKELSLAKIYRFIGTARQHRQDILLTQPGTHSASAAPDTISPAIELLLGKDSGIPHEYVQACWDTFKCIIWDEGESFDGSNDDEDSVQYAQDIGLTPHTLYPPSHYCDHPECTRKAHLRLTKAQQRKVIFFTLDEGARPAYSVHLYCEDCRTNYHSNYRVRDGQRIYYDDLPDAVQVGEHQFVERRVIDLFINLMLVSWTSATNCTRFYDNSLSQRRKQQKFFRNWQFKLELTTEQVWDGVIIVSLLEDHLRRHSTLVVPHTGDQKDRYTEAVRARNARMRLYGQSELTHYCDKCTHIYRHDDGTIRGKVSVVVTDGITIGHPCCAIHNCQIPLANNRHRFCPRHTSLDAVCSIVGCNSPVIEDKLTCSDANHRAIEQRHKERGQARFQLKERLLRARVAHPNDAVAEERDLKDLEDAHDVVADFDVDENGRLMADNPCPSKDENPKRKIRAQFGRKRTANEQIIVAPCGMIIARQTFFGAEAVSSVIEMVKRTYHHSPHLKPDHIFYDNNCHLARLVKDDPFFSNIGLSVDVFHFNCKHSETDDFCQMNCNPISFPELLTEEGEWAFNSSIAEQTNVWLGGYHSIVREMLVDKFNFFLDEMILRKNQMTREKLTREGRNPGNWPAL